jgi:hypothetical protein
MIGAEVDRDPHPREENAVNRVPSLLHRPWLLVGSILCVLIAQAPRAEQVSELQVRIVNGATDLLAGSYVELRIYETGGALRKLPLTHGEGWPHDTTRIIPVALEEPLDPRRVERFSLYYSAASTAAPPWQVAAADVDLAAGHVPAHILLAATLSGEIHRQGEIMSRARDTSAMTCLTDAECDDGRSCNGRERCAPQSPSADERGCVRGKPVACPVNQICSEGHGCVGASAFAPKPADLPVEPAPLAGAGAGAVPDAGAAATTSADP